MSNRQPPGLSAMEERIQSPQKTFSLPSGARQVILVRHGSTVGDTERTVSLGTLKLADPELLPEGHSQSHAVARRLQHESLAAIFATPLTRTQQSAAPLAALTGLPVGIVPELHEIHMGDWEHDFHTRAAEGDALLRQMILEETWEVIPNAEREEAVAARVRTGIARVVEAIQPGEAAVAFIHGGIVAELCRQATKSSRFAFFAPENASVSKLIVHDDGRWLLRSFNDVSHLMVPA